MPSQTSVLLDAVGPQVGYGMPFGGMYSNVYGSGQGQGAQDAYWQALSRGYDNQQQQLLRDAYGNDMFGGSLGGAGVFANAIDYDPTTGQTRFDISRVSPEDIKKFGGAQKLQEKWQQLQNDPNEDRVQARQQLEQLAQKRAAQNARLAQSESDRQGFLQELGKYNAPSLMGSMITPQIQQAGNQVMANANAAGMAGGSMGQAANRRAAMMGFGQGAAAAVPQAAVQQANLNFQYQNARQGLIQNYYQQQNQRAQQDMENQMRLTGFQKGMEQYEHDRSVEGLKAAGSFIQNMGAVGANVAGAVAGG